MVSPAAAGRAGTSTLMENSWSPPAGAAKPRGERGFGKELPPRVVEELHLAKEEAGGPEKGPEVRVEQVAVGPGPAEVRVADGAEREIGLGAGVRQRAFPG